jgi:beta-lactamase class A
MTTRGIVLLLAMMAPASGCAQQPSDWPSKLRSQVEALDASSPGELGVYVKRLDGSGEMAYDASRPWYLSSTIKVPVAVLLLEKVEAGEIALARELEIDPSDAVDGAGELQHAPPGSKRTVAVLLEKMLVQSDSTATDKLIRLIGEDELNEFLRHEGFGPATTLLQVRHDAYSELHPDARKLTNRDFIELKASAADARHEAFARRLGVDTSELLASSVPEAFERYYRRGLNSAPLDAFGRLLERLAKGELLSREHSDLILGHMQEMVTGDHRLKAGLPPGTRFAQKTGTQIGRICNVGIIDPGEPDALVVAACVEKFDEQSRAEALLADVARALRTSGAL